MLLRVVVTATCLVSRASLSRGDVWHFDALIWALSSFELGCFFRFAPCLFLWKDALCPWWRLLSIVKGCPYPYKYLPSSLPHFRLLEFLLKVPERGVVQRDNARTVVRGGFFFFSHKTLHLQVSLLFHFLLFALVVCFCGRMWLSSGGFSAFRRSFIFLHLSGAIFTAAFCVCHSPATLCLVGNHRRELTFSSSNLFKTSNFLFSSL